MMLDIQAIEGYVSDAESLALEAVAAPEQEIGPLVRRIDGLGGQFEAIIRLHMEKIERIYLPLLEELPARTSTGSSPTWPRLRRGPHPRAVLGRPRVVRPGTLRDIFSRGRRRGSTPCRHGSRAEDLVDPS
jgi:hypothetical protein